MFNGCASVTLQDHIIDVPKGELGAVEFHTLTSTTRKLSKAEWQAKEVGMVCMNIKYFAQDKAVFEKLCSDSPGLCKYDTTEAVDTFFTKVNQYASPKFNLESIR